MTNKSNFYQAFWLSISSASSMLVAILSSIILSRFFDKVEYGTYRQIIFVYTTLIVVFQAGIPTVFTFFLPRYSKGEGKYIMRIINRILFISGAIFSLFLFFSSERIAYLLGNPALEEGLKLFSIFPIFTLPTIGVEGICTVNKTTEQFAVYNVLTRIFQLVCIIFPVVFIKNSYIVAVIGWGCANFITFILALYLKNSHYKNEQEVIIDGITKEIFHYTLPIAATSLVLILFNSVNQFYISRYIGTEVFADYSNGFVTLPFVPIVIAPIRSILVPLFAKASKSGDYNSALISLQNGIKQSSIIVIPIIVYSFVNAEDIVVLLYGDQYVTSAYFFRLFLVLNVCEVFMYQGVINAIGKSIITFRLELVCAICVWGADALLIFVLKKLGYVLLGNVNFAYLIILNYIIATIMVKYILPYVYIITKPKLKILDINTIQWVGKCLIHSLLISFVTYFINRELIFDCEIVVKLCSYAFIYFSLLITTQKIVKINYLDSLFRILRRK